jgi:hypothetical protein
LNATIAYQRVLEPLCQITRWPFLVCDTHPSA